MRVQHVFFLAEEDSSFPVATAGTITSASSSLAEVNMFFFFLLACLLACFARWLYYTYALVGTVLASLLKYLLQIRLDSRGSIVDFKIQISEVGFSTLDKLFTTENEV